jgi:hypothetical protein
MGQLFIFQTFCIYIGRTLERGKEWGELFMLLIPAEGRK